MTATLTADETLTLALEVFGEHAEDALDRADVLAAAARRLLPGRPEIGVELGEENVIGFHGDETSLRLLMALGVKRGWVCDSDTFEELAGLE